MGETRSGTRLGDLLFCDGGRKMTQVIIIVAKSSGAPLTDPPASAKLVEPGGLSLATGLCGQGAQAYQAMLVNGGGVGPEVDSGVQGQVHTLPSHHAREIWCFGSFQRASRPEEKLIREGTLTGVIGWGG